MSLKESVVFDNLIGKSEKVSIIDKLGIEQGEVEDTPDQEWKKHWKGMPEFEQEDKKTYKTVYVHFRNKEDYEEFAKLIGQKLTMKTKSIWHPALDREANSLLRWIEDENSSTD